MNKKKKTTTKMKEKFGVFEFDDDMSIEQYPKRFPRKLESHGNKKSNSGDQSPITKYHFLQSFARGTETVDQGFRTESIDVDAKGGLQYTYSAISPNSTLHGDSPVKVENSGVDAYLISSSSSQNTKKFSRVSFETLSTEMSSLSTSTFCSEENKMSSEEQQIEPDCGGYKLDDKNKTVNIFPDYIIYRDTHLTKSCLTFSCHCIKIEGSSFTGTCKSVSFQWAIGDIISIESEWSELVKTAIVTLHLKVTGNANKTSGFEPVCFSVYDPYWAKRLEAIKSLDVRYKDKWNIDFDANVVSGRKHLFGQSSMFSPTSCIPGYDEHFEEVIYPEGDPDAVIISKRDVELLQPETFINDNIIDFYVKYLANKIQSEKRHRFHFFNSFFFRKLADLDKDPSSAYEGKAAFQRVRKWTRKVNLFVKDYIFIPVNYSLHWSLLVICHPGEVPNFKGEESGSTSKVPCILHMDSIKGSHRGLKNLIQSYLCEEWKERHSGTTEDILSKFLNLRFVPLELPQQENLFDCGIFLLHYVELFLEEAPLEFSLFNISKFSKFLTKNWFLPVEASLKRRVIKKVIYEIHDYSHKTHLADTITECPVVPNETGNQETGVMSLEKIGSAIKKCHDTASTSNAEKSGISLSETSLLRGDQCGRESGAIARQSTDANLQLSAPYGRSILSPIEETEEARGQVSRSPLDKEECHQVAKSTSDLFSRFHSGDLETLKNNEHSVSCRKVNEGDPISGTSSGFPTFPEIAIHVVIPIAMQDLEGSNHLAEPDKEESSSTSCKELTARVADDTEEGNNEISSTPICIENKACVVPDSEEDSNEISYIPCIDVEHDFGKRDRPTENIIRKRNFIRKSTNLPSSSGNALSKSDELRTTKKQRIKATMGERRVTRSLSNALHI
ncbi:probable ubiquitin-like-specific protease 2A isoform X3 [Humulus lupulus]|uniref:probable ubiquitin-like-specific protease 2A isoform X3 n=1 Tax=Humulus lupulus TaxID=3486 RepID=UPI002B406F8B|nr:probable ubiquitin-like-specific protease 2A isoform X3 [Humulus lupulus]